MKVIRAGLYTRVSKPTQNLENQLADLRAFVERQGWIPAAEYSDKLSGSDDRRPGLNAALRDASRRKFDVFVVWDLSRLTRRGPASAFEIIERLQHTGVELWSYREEQFRTGGPIGRLLISVAAFIAEQERETMQERIKAGQRSARARGVHIGRSASIVSVDRILKLKAENHSIRSIAAILKTSPMTIQRRLRKHQDQEELKKPA